MQPEDAHLLAEHSVVDPGQDREDLALFRGIARRRILLRSGLVENRKRRVHPLPRQFFAAEDFDGALPDRFGAGMFELIGLLGKPGNRGTARRTHSSSVAQKSRCRIHAGLGFAKKTTIMPDASGPAS